MNTHSERNPRPSRAGLASELKLRGFSPLGSKNPRPSGAGFFNIQWGFLTRWIRWQGLIAFLVLTTAIFVFFYLFVDQFVERTIEKTGAALVGARVDLDAADLILVPLGLRLQRLQVTDPDEPMTNAVEIAQIGFSMDTLNLFRRKVIIEEMRVDKVQFNTPRKTSGALPRAPEKKPSVFKSVVEKIPFPSLEVPDVQEILEKEGLESLKLIQAIQEEVRGEREKWRQRLQELPDKAKLENYRERIKKIKSARKDGLEGILGGAAEAITLERDFKAELDQIKKARMALKSGVETLQKRVSEATKAPLDDVRRLKEKYALTPQGLSNLSRMFLGPEVGHWTETTLRWYERLRPVVARVAEQHKAVTVTKPPRGKGVDVHFEKENPVPDFLVRQARVSVEIPAGVLTGRIDHITPDPDVLGKPMTFSFSGEGLNGLQSIKLDGEFNHVDPARWRDQARLKMNNYRIQDFIFSKGEDFPLVLDTGLADFEVGVLVMEDSLRGEISATFRSVQLSARLSEEAQPLVRAIVNTLSTIRGFHFKARITGTIEDHDLDLTSDLDRVLKEAIGKQLKEQAERFESRLRAAVSEKVDRELADLKSRLGELEVLMDELTDRLKLGEGLLKEIGESGRGGLKLPF